MKNKFRLLLSALLLTVASGSANAFWGPFDFWDGPGWGGWGPFNSGYPYYGGYYPYYGGGYGYPYYGGGYTPYYAYPPAMPTPAPAPVAPDK